MTASLFADDDDERAAQDVCSDRRTPAAGTPLAERMRPRTLDEVVGQDEILAPGQAAARGHRARPAAVDHPLGSAGHRQDHARADHRRA